ALATTVYSWSLKSGAPTAAQSRRLQTLAVARAAAGMAFSVSEGTDFDSVYYDIFGIPARLLPLVPELTAIRTTTGSTLALLLEIPEPLDWDRVSLSIQSDSGGAALTVGLLRSADRTRAILLRPGPSSTNAPDAWPGGNYDLELGYALD